MIQNEVNLTGNVGAKPTLANLANDSKLCSFSIATNEGYKDKNGNWVDNTVWHQLTAFGKLGEIVEKTLEKGDKVQIKGRLSYSNYEKNGVKHYVTNIVIESFIKLSKS